MQIYSLIGNLDCGVRHCENEQIINKEEMIRKIIIAMQYIDPHVGNLIIATTICNATV